MVDDRQLIDRVLAGDPRVADAFVTRFTRLVWAILIRQTALAVGQIEDVYQEVFVRLWEDDYRRIRNWSRDGDFAAYLAPIVRHLALDALRKSPGDRERPLPEPDEADTEPIVGDPSPEELAHIGQRRELLEQALLRLSVRDNELYELRFVQELSYLEISEQMGITVNNVGVRLTRLADRLKRSCLAEMPGRPGETPRGRGAVRLPGPSPSTE